jgi:glucokinase
MYLAGDIGGTKTHLAIFKQENGEYQMLKEKKYPSKEFGDFTTLIKEFVEGFSNIEKMCLGIAGPIRNGVCRATNLPWVIDAKLLSKELGIKKVALINDLESNAYGLMVLKEEDFYLLNKGDSNYPGNGALISAGTGLGEAGLFFHKGRFVPFASEGGHTDFAPRDELEIALLRFLMKKYGSHISYERVLSGQGLVEVYHFLLDSKREKVCDFVEERMKSEDPAKVISEEGVKGSCSACKNALHIFCSIYGSEAGNCALKYMALGGLYIGGGIAPKILPFIPESAFLSSFLSKGRMKPLLEKIPIKIVLKEKTALLGSVFYCEKYL